MEFQQLKYVCAIADTGSFSRAAERCHVAQPSLSQQVLKLEEDLGAKLFDRLGRSIRLTEAGRAFLPHARTILHQMEAARTGVEDKRKDVRGSVTVGVIPTIAPYLMPQCVSAFSKRYEEAKLRIIEETTPILVESLRNLAIDVAIMSLPLKHKEFEIFPLQTEPLFAVLPRDHKRAAAQSLSMKDLRGEPFVLLRDSHCFRDISVAACTRARVDPRIAFESGQFSSLLGMVAAGVGVSLVPEMAVDRTADCSFVRISDTQASRTIVAAVLRGRTFNRVQQAFLDHLRSHAAARQTAARKQPASK
jgi:LysR family transcriptional regulator, hydrogen peroxide-inducible genes activator